MKKKLFLVASTAIFLISTTSWALVPWSIVPITATTFTISPNATASVQYTVTNNSVTHTLMMVPIEGISQISTGAGICSNPFTLTKGASCILSLQVNGSALTTNINSGPQICQQGADGQPSPQLCYQPASQSASLNITSSTTALAIGDSFGGGIVACLDGAPYLNLIVATTDNSTGIRWNNGVSFLTNSASYEDGLTNTNTIVNSQGAVITSYAAGVCQQYAGGGYHDWFLPAIYQLNCLFTNNVVVVNPSWPNYWSATETGRFNVLFENFGNGNQISGGKTNLLAVRCVRGLSL